jgi:flavin reductase (DIM6/NTAB) family NADH-FMN oxidoreductase RutF
MADHESEPEAFDRLIGSLDHPMLVVTTAADGRRAGCLVGFHSQCGIEPPTYAVWLSKLNHTYRIARRADTFALHVLRADQHALADLFGGETGDDVDKFSRCGWTEGPDGVPLLDDSPDRVIAERVDLVDVGADHACLVVRPARTDRDDQPAGGWLMFSATKDVEAGHPPDEATPTS